MLVIFITQIISGRADSVHYHLCDIFTRHRNAIDNVLISRRIIHPVFKMMFISALMMQPGLRQSCFLSLGIIRTSVSLIIFTSNQKFYRFIFRQVMEQSLFIQTCPETIMHDQQFMSGYCFKVQPRMHLSSPPLLPAIPQSYAVRSPASYCIFLRFL